MPQSRLLRSLVLGCVISGLPHPCLHAGEAKHGLDHAITLIKRDNDKEALMEINSVIAQDPKEAQAYYYRGLINEHNSDYDNAIADFTRAISLDSKDYKFYTGRGEAYFWKKRDFGRTISDLTKAIELNPYQSDAYVIRGVAHRLRHEYHEALMDFDEAIQINPNNDEAYSRRAEFYENTKGESAKAQIDWDKSKQLRRSGGLRKWTKAIASLTKQIESVSNSKENNSYHRVSAYIERGILYAGQGYFDEAIFDLTRAIELSEKDARQDYGFLYDAREAHYHRGLAFAQLRKYDLAIADYNSVLKWNNIHASKIRDALPSSPGAEMRDALYPTGVYATNAFTGLGYAYEAEGKKDLAIGYYSKAIESAPIPLQAELADAGRKRLSNQASH